MAFIGNVNTDNVPTNPFDPIPAGEYIAVIVDSQEKANKAGDGSYINLQFKVADGEFAGRVVFDKLNLVNKSEKAVNIARGQLAAIKKATGLMHAQDTAEFHDIPIRIKVAVEKDTYNGKETIDNVVKGYYPVVGSPTANPSPVRPAPAASPAAAAGQPAASPAAASRPPWLAGKAA